MSEKNKSILSIIATVIFFILASYLVQSNSETIKEYIDYGFWGVLAYILINIISTVVAPISALPLIVVASNLWGWFWAGLLSILGWTIGSLIAFSIARKYGVPLVSKFVSLEKINRIEKRVPQSNLFMAVVFLRIVAPVDIISYALGLFSKISTGKYILATVIGITPFAFIFAFTGTLPFIFQIIVVIIAIILMLIGFMITFRRKH